MNVKIIGCGLSGITAARILEDRGHNVKIFESRSHIGGNCYDSNLNGIMVHNYGPHFFHTNDEDVFSFLSRYTQWREYYNRPMGNTKLGLISLPYSRKTIREIGRELTPEEIADIIFKDYSEKQWGVPISQISKSIFNRIPKTRECEDPTWYEGEKYQCLPTLGYTEMMRCMLDGIDVEIGCHSDDWKKRAADLTIFTGKIDEYIEYVYGELPYRTLEFRHSVQYERLLHPIINQNMSHIPFTRMYDHSYFSHLRSNLTVVTEEYSSPCLRNKTPFYPITFGAGPTLYLKYKKLAEREKATIFLGRLATYSYLDMWMAVKQAMIRLREI
jgi:UDP-galactopyranose mutase